MRYFWILLLAFAPLLGLTSWSLVDALVLRKDEVAAPVDIPPASATEQEALVAAQRAREVAAAEGPLVERWAASDLGEMKPPPIPSPASESLLAPAAQAWQRSRRGRDFLARCRAALSGPLDADPLEASKQERARLAALLAADVAREFGDLPGVETFLRDLRQRDDLLARRIAVEARRIEVEQAVLRVERMLVADEADPKQAQACLEQLERPPLGDVQKLKSDGLDYTERLAAVRARAECRIQWAGIPTSPVERADPAELLRVTGFLERFTNSLAATHLTGSERRYLELAAGRKRRLEMAAKVAAISEAEELSELLVLAADVVDDPDIAPSDKRKARDAVLSQLRDVGLPRLAVPEILRGEVREVITTDEKRFIGYFQKVGDVKYRFWHDKDDRRDAPLGTLDIRVTKIDEGPVTPHYVQWADGLNNRLDELMARPGDRGLWERLSASLARWERDYREYQTRWQQSAHEADQLCSGWSFRRHRETVDEVLAHWEAFSRLSTRPPSRTPIEASQR